MRTGTVGPRRYVRVGALAGAAALIGSLLWLDANGPGPVNAMARCNLLLSRTDEPAADVLIVGSSRTGAALDPKAMQRMLTVELGRPVRVDRLALGYHPARAMVGLVGNYLDARGTPAAIVLEVMVMTERTVGRIARFGLATTPEHWLYRRDTSLLGFRQLLAQPAVAMPFIASEGALELWSHRLAGVSLRAGALLQQALHSPLEAWQLGDCSREDWTREAGWGDFAFAYGDSEPKAPLNVLIDTLADEVARKASRELKTWQVRLLESRAGATYPYDFAAAYRRGEMMLLDSMIESVQDAGPDVEVELLPLPLYGYEVDPLDLRALDERYGANVRAFDLYGAVGVGFDSLWFDDSHVERFPVGELLTALIARRLLQSGALARPGTKRGG